MIKLIRLEWSNWFSYGSNNAIDFTKDKVTQLVGEVGAGKSSIPLILQEVLYGKNVKGIKKADIRNRKTKVNAAATLIFTKENTEYEVNVIRKLAGVSIVLMRDGIDISHHKATDTYKEVEAILGLDFNLFAQLTYQSSKAALSFLTDTDTNRKKFLISLFSLEQYVDMHNKYKDAVKEITSTVDKIKGSVLTINSWLTDNEHKHLEHIVAKLMPVRDESLVARRDSLLASLATIKQTNKLITSNNEYKRLLANISAEDLMPPESSKIAIGAIQNAVTTLRHEVNREITEISKIKILDNVCVTCGQDIDNSIYTDGLLVLQKSIGLNKQKLVLREAELREATNINNLWKNHDKVLAEFESLSGRIDETIAEEALVEFDMVNDISGIAKAITLYEDTVKEAIAFNNKADINNTTKQVIEDQLTAYGIQLIEQKEKLLEAESLSSYLMLLRDIFSNKGLVSFKIQYLVQDLQVEIAKYLSKLSNGRFQVEFKLQGDKLNIVIYDNGTEIDINSLSSGETSKVNIATLLAVRSLMSSIANTKLNILFLDESINTLDSDSMDSLVDCLMEETNLNIYLMSHSFTNPLINVINIVKEKGLSRLDYGSK